MLALALYLFKKHAVVKIVAPKSDVSIVHFEDPHKRQFDGPSACRSEAVDPLIHPDVPRSCLSNDLEFHWSFPFK